MTEGNELREYERSRLEGTHIEGIRKGEFLVDASPAVDSSGVIHWEKYDLIKAGIIKN